MANNQIVPHGRINLTEMGISNPLLQRVEFLVSIYRQGVLAYHLIRDRRVNRTTKIIPLLGVAYVLLPIDLFPELMGGPLGLIDDFAVLALVLNWFIQSVPYTIVEEHAVSLGYVRPHSTEEITLADDKPA
ncbi:MAG: DUF1232 domain-containing protein [Anaerolineae bacterium]|nr:DUF1232 domain-containing protein [Anaerolineae bacterium]